MVPRSHRAEIAERVPAVDDPSELKVGDDHSAWVRWAHWVAFHPWRSGIAATLMLLVLAIPMLDMRLGQADAGTDPTTTSHRRAYDLLGEGFGDGFNGPLLLTVDVGSYHDPAILGTIAKDVMADPSDQTV